MASAIGTALFCSVLQPMLAKARDTIKDKGLAIGRYIADKAKDKAVDKPMGKALDMAMAMVADKIDGIVNIDGDISKLQSTLRMIQSIVRVAEEKQIDDVYIQNWLCDLVDIGYEARDVLDDFITSSSCIIRAEEVSNHVNFIYSFLPSYFGGSSSDTSNIQLTVLNRLEKDIRSVTERFDEKIKESEKFNTLISVVGGGGSESVRVDRRPKVGPFINKQEDGLFLGREDVKKGIMDKILHPSDNRVDVDVIWGMGGIGKTTLAQSIYNDERVKEVPRRWLCVGENTFNAEKVIGEIIGDSSTKDVESLQKKLVKKFEGNRFLIVLDDVWNVDGSEWELLFNPLTELKNGGLIIITRRKRQLCTAITIQMAYNLEPLSEEDSWSIFESCAYVNGKVDSTSDLKGIGEKIVKKLNGHPLALKVVGRSLLDKDFSTWTDFLEFKFSEDDEVMSALKWSYNHLPPHLKACFTFCSLFPEDHILDKKVLVEMWMAHDLIQKEEQERPEDVGAQYFKELVNASLLQSRDDGKYVMHDLIHDLALLVSIGEFATTNSSLSIDQMEKVRHITLTTGDYSKIPRLCKIEKLLTLYTTDVEIYPAEKYVLDVFNQLKSIRVLVLCGIGIEEIPDCISKLKHLRYLDVSQTRVKHLPNSVCRLYNLQMIATSHLFQLPIDIVNISSLRYIRASLSTCKGVGKLTSLQELSSIRVCRGDNIKELGGMQRLRGKLRIEGLENVTSSEDAAGALMEKKILMDTLELVFDEGLAGSTISEKVLDALGCPPNLTYLQIDGYNGVKPPSWMVDGMNKFHKVQTLVLCNCPKLKSLYETEANNFHKLSSLEELKINYCPQLQSLPPDFHKLSSLSRLVIQSCNGLKRLQLDALVSLKDLNIWRCESLVQITSAICEKLQISSCRLLEKMDVARCDSVQVVMKILKLEDCESLRSLSIDIHGLDSFEDLDITGCPTTLELASEDGSSSSSSSGNSVAVPIHNIRTDNTQVFRTLLHHELVSLESLDIRNLGGFENFDETEANNFCKSRSIKSLRIQHCMDLKSLPADLHKLSSLSRLEICDCDGLKRLQLDALVCLKELEISNCRSLVQITSAICERLQISSCRLLEKMDVARCDSLQVVMKILKLEDCESFRSLSVDIHGMDSLEDLDITDCPTLELTFEDGSSSSSSSRNLVAVPIHDIRTDSTQVFRTLLHHEIVSLESLDIRNLGGFENFDETEANNFCKSRSLKSLFIWECKDLKSLPPDFHKLSSLKKLRIENCLQLQSLPPDFHKLSSLKMLSIISCPQLQSLPADGLPPSLSDLSIIDCLLLYERCKDKSGLDWHKINHIPKRHIR